MMTGLMPTGKFHIGHMILAQQMIFYQKLGAKIYIAVADIEAYNARQQSLEDSRKIAEDYLGKDNVVTLERRATAEDFAYFSQVVPGCFYRLGTASENGDNRFSVHHPQFNIDEKAIELGMGLMAFMAIAE